MGGMISFYLNVTHPDFVCRIHVRFSQWDTNVLQPLVGKKFLHQVSDADLKVFTEDDRIWGNSSRRTVRSIVR